MKSQRSIQPMPKAISEAVSAVMMDMHAVAKGGHNTYDDYKFVSVDDIYGRVVRAMGGQGLVIIPLEVEVEHVAAKNKRGETVTRAKFTHQFVLSCGGETWTDDTCCRTVAMQIDRATNYAAAGSYLEKAFLRSLFKIPTGEVEVEELESARMIKEDKDDGKAKREQPKRSGKSYPKQIKDDNRWADFVAAAEATDNWDMLNAIGVKYSDIYENNAAKQDPFEDVLEHARMRIKKEQEQMALHKQDAFE